MLRAGIVGCAIACASCAEPSRLDHAASGSAAEDPWATPAKPSGDAERPARGKGGGKPDGKDDGKDDGKGALGGIDLGHALSTIADSMRKPGPYEAPEHSKDLDEARPHWGVLALSGEVVERSALSWSGSRGTELRALIDRLRELARDDKLTGVLIRAGDLEISQPDAVELRAAIHDLRKAGKTVACHGERAGNAGYLVLAACDRIALAPLGEIAITGPALVSIHVKPLLDKLGIQADFLHVGAYKGAAEPLTLDAPSKQTEETYGAILDRRYQTMVDVVATERKLPPAKVVALIDTGLFPADQAAAAALIDDVAAFEAFRDAQLRGAAWTRLDLHPERANPLAMMSTAWRFLGAMPLDRPPGGHVAVVYAIGSIIDGDGDGVLGARGQIASHTLVAALRQITADDRVKAVVLRIDSGGGSAQASELIWRAVAELKAKKPVVVSMSDVAASGGYYIACGATKIFALEDTLTGSIGVVGGKLAVREALARIGVRAYPMGRGKRATMAEGLAPWTDDERSAIRASMESVYRVFVGRVAEGRHKQPAEIEPIAQGRVWTGARAKELGLIDEIGGLDAAIAEAQKLAGVDAATDLEVYPPAPTLRDIVASFGQVQAPLGVAATARSALQAVAIADPRVAAAAERLVQLVASFRSSTIQAVAMPPVMP